MGMTRGNILDRMAVITGDSSTSFRAHMETSLNNMMYYLWDLHDWNWKHKTGTFNTVSGTESYDLSASSTDMRSSEDVEVLYDSTNGRFLRKVDLREIRKRYPKEDSSGQPIVYAPWGSKTIYLHDEPNGTYTMKYLYLSKPTVPTADANDLESFCGIPDHAQYLLEKLLTSEAFLVYDDGRRVAMLEEIERLWKPRAMQADMKHLESGARFKFWEEELAPTGQTYDDFLRHAFWNDRN